MRRPLLVALAALLASAPAAAQEQVLGSSLSGPPNWGAGCEVELDFFDPGPTAQGLYSQRVTNKDCTWFQPTSVPGNGRIRSIRVGGGTGATRFRFVVLRTLQGQGGPAGGGCCFFVAEFPPAPQPPLTLPAGGITQFPVDIPVERNASIQTGIVSADFLGISAEPNTGELPLRVFGNTSTLAGPTSASFYYPRLGALPTDATSSRNPKGIPGVEVLMQSTFVPAGTPGGGTGGVNPPPLDPGGEPAPGQPGPAPAALAPELASAALRVARNRAIARLVCGADAACAGTVELLAAGARSAAKRRRPRSYGRTDYSIAAGATEKVRVSLNRRGRKLMRRKPRATLTLRLSPEGGEPVEARVTLRRPRR